MEISLHLLDLLQNCAFAQATCVSVSVLTDKDSDRLLVTVEDNGRGMDEEESRRALDPFYTSHKLKKVGLGLPLIAEAAKMAGGDITVESRPGRGTKVEVTLSLSHIDRQPIGDLAATIVSFLAGNPEIETRLFFKGQEGSFTFVSSQLVPERERRAMGQIAFLSLAEEILRDGLARAGFRPDGGGAIG
ncbi:MAG: ATP-binding protein [Bacillota bacterium]|jgi:hypothetical protein